MAALLSVPAKAVVLQNNFDILPPGTSIVSTRWGTTTTLLTASYPFHIESFAPSNVATASPPIAMRPARPWADYVYPASMPIRFDRGVRTVSVKIGNDDPDYDQCFPEGTTCDLLLGWTRTMKQDLLPLSTAQKMANYGTTVPITMDLSVTSPTTTSTRWWCAAAASIQQRDWCRYRSTIW